MTALKVRPPTLLHIDSDRYAVSLLRQSLSATTYKLHQASTATEGLQLASDLFPDMILLDLDLPDSGEGQVISRLRTFFAEPIMVISASNAPENKIQALDQGADDFLGKPFDVGELQARVRACLRSRSTRPMPSDKMRNGPLEVDFHRRLVLVDGKPVSLTPREYALLMQLLRNVGCVMTHRQLLAKVWGPSSIDDVQYLRIYIGSLRQKLGSAAKALLTQPGIGYRMASWSDD